MPQDIEIVNGHFLYFAVEFCRIWGKGRTKFFVLNFHHVGCRSNNQNICENEKGIHRPQEDWQAVDG